MSPRFRVALVLQAVGIAGLVVFWTAEVFVSGPNGIFDFVLSLSRAVPALLWWAWTALVARNATGATRKNWLAPRIASAAFALVVLGVASLFAIVVSLYSGSAGTSSVAATAIAFLIALLLLIVAEVAVIVAALSAWQAPP